MQTNNQGGSFGLPADMVDEIRKVEAKRGKPIEEAQPEQETSDVEEMLGNSEEKPAPTPSGNKTEEPELTEKEKKAKVAEVLAEIRKDLGIEITEDDIWSFLYNNEIIKKDVVIFPGKMHATFKTLSLDATNDVDSKMAEIMEDKMLENGFKNKNTQFILAHGLVEIGKPGKIKNFGETFEERYKEIGTMSALLVEKLSRKWNEFIFLVDESVKEEMESKKD